MSAVAERPDKGSVTVIFPERSYRQCALDTAHICSSCGSCLAGRIKVRLKFVELQSGMAPYEIGQDVNSVG